MTDDVVALLPVGWRWRRPLRSLVVDCGTALRRIPHQASGRLSPYFFNAGLSMTARARPTRSILCTRPATAASSSTCSSARLTRAFHRPRRRLIELRGWAQRARLTTASKEAKDHGEGGSPQWRALARAGAHHRRRDVGGHRASPSKELRRRASPCRGRCAGSEMATEDGADVPYSARCSTRERLACRSAPLHGWPICCSIRNGSCK